MDHEVLAKALMELCPGSEWSAGDTYASIVWHKGNGHDKPSESAVNTKVTEITNAKPMVELRRQRDARLAECDWVVTKALESGSYDGVSKTLLFERQLASNWKTYRQALRDLPASASPQLDDNGNLTNVTWPTKPS